MKTSELDYELPKDLIAQHPAPERDSSRLMVVKKDSGEITHHHFREISDFLQAGDLVVTNDTRVMPARLQLVRDTGGQVDVLLAESLDGSRWKAFLNCRGQLNEKELLKAPDGSGVLKVGERSDGFTEVELLGEARDIMNQWGGAPLPPYIKRASDARRDSEDIARYQTVYARYNGSVAAPTAGLHFTDELIVGLKSAGVEFASVTLHVGAGTFLPVKTEKIEDHVMHKEHFEVPPQTLDDIGRCRKEGGRVFCVGTTTCRALETVAQHRTNTTGWTDLFIRPPYKFQMAEALITNFHLPKSTLLLLVYAFGGTELVRKAYEEAVRERYRFYSYGDAMLVI